jgi:hypothetical protein
LPSNALPQGRKRLVFEAFEYYICWAFDGHIPQKSTTYSETAQIKYQPLTGTFFEKKMKLLIWLNFSLTDAYNGEICGPQDSRSIVGKMRFSGFCFYLTTLT